MKKAKKIMITLTIVLTLASPFIATSLYVAGGGGIAPPIVTMAIIK